MGWRPAPAQGNVPAMIRRLLTLLLTAPLLTAAAPVRLAATPALTPEGRTLIFEWQGDLWTVASTGGSAHALTRHPAVDRFPVVSPDGTRVAFMSGRDDTFQVYVMALTGGVPVRVTHHSDGAVPQDWHPDGRRLLVRGSRDTASFLPQRLCVVDTLQPRAEELLFDDAADWGRWAPDGQSVLFMRAGEDLYRRGYRGSKAATVWQYTTVSQAFTNRAAALDQRECRWPLWRPDGRGFYYVREGDEGCLNIWEREVESGREVQRTFLREYGVILPCLSRDGSTMVFRSGFDFYLWRPGGRTEPVRLAIQVANDEVEENVRRLSYNRAQIDGLEASCDFTADLKQLVFAAGGSLWIMDATTKDPVRLTSGSGHIDNWASFTPGGSAIYFLRDDGDRANIWKARREDEKLPWWRNRQFILEPVTDDARGRTSLSVDPTGQRLAWTEAPGSLWVAKLDGSEPRRVVTSPQELSYDWSPDGLWLATSVQDSDDNRDVWIVSATGARDSYNLSGHPNWDGNPAWSPDGRVIAFVGRTYDNEVDIYYAWLRREDHGRLPMETERRKAEESEPGKEKEKEAAKPTTNAPVRIDFDGLADRVERLRTPGSTPSHLFWSWDSKALAFQGRIDGKDGTWKLFFPHPGKPEFMTATRGTWARWNQAGISWVVEGVPAQYENRLNFTVRLERDQQQWRRLGFRLMWRAMRDEFYDGRLNNLDWRGLRARYESVIDEVDDAGFARLANMMFGELNASHLDFRAPEDKTLRNGSWRWQSGHLGVRFDPTHAGPGLRVREIIAGLPADRDLTRLQPGDVITALDGQPVQAGQELGPLLNGPLPREVLVQLERAGQRREFRLPLTSPDDVREKVREAEIAAAQARVAEWSQGRAGYISIARMQTEDLRQFEKEVYAQGYGRDALVIDVRNNQGGFTADQILSILCHPPHAVTIPRDGVLSYQGGYLGRPFWNKPLVVLCNAYTVSNGEIFSHAIKTIGRGKLIGQPTQGGVISTRDRPLLDLGTYRIPHRAWFPRSTGLDMERHGAIPDILVEDPPGARARGEDPPLKAAVTSVLADLAAGAGQPPKVRYASEPEPAP